MADTNATKAAISARFGDQVAAGGNGTTAPEFAAPTVTEELADQGIGLPPVIDEPPAAQPMPTIFGKKPKAPAAPAAAQAKLNRVLPEAHRIKIYKRLSTGASMYIDEYAPSDIAAGGGTVEAFIKRHLKAFFEPGINYFRVSSIDGIGNERQHGEIPIAGDPIIGGAAPAPIPTPASEAFRDPIRAMNELEELNAKRHAAWRAQQDELRVEREQMQTAIKEMTSGGGQMGQMMGFMMMQQMRHQATPPPDPYRESELLDKRISSHLEPVAKLMNSMAERIERLASTPINTTPVTPPPDPIDGLAKILEAIRPPAPAAAPAAPSPLEVLREVRDIMRQQEPKDSFSFKDYIALKDREEERHQRERERQEAAMDRRLAELKEGRPKDGIAAALETVKAIKEASGIFNGDATGGTFLDKAAEAVTSPDFWSGLGEFVATIKGQGAEGEGEGQEIAATETTPQPQAPPPRPRKTPAVKPADMASTDYPEGFDTVVAELAKFAAEEPQTPEAYQAQIMGIMACFSFLMRQSDAWNRRVRAGLQKVAFGGPKQVPLWINPFIDGMAAAGKLSAPAVAILKASFAGKAEVIVGYIRSKFRKPRAANSPATQPVVPLAP